MRYTRAMFSIGLLALAFVAATTIVTAKARSSAQSSVQGATTVKTPTESPALLRSSKAPTDVEQPETSRIKPIGQPEPTDRSTGAAASFEIPWSSVNGGGGPSSSTNYAVNASAGQSTIGHSSSTNYQVGTGYWYGVSAAGGGCSCPFQSDINEDGFIDSIDLSLVIDIVFFGAADPLDPECPTTRGDFNNDGFADSIDLSLVIDHVFFGAPGPANPC